MAYRGLTPGRDADVVGAGVAWARLNLNGTSEECAVEMFYKVQATPKVSIQPDIQYVASPSGRFRDALAVGLRFQAAL